MGADSKVDKYCQVIVSIKPGFTLHPHKTAVISFGEDNGLFNFKDAAVIQQLSKVNELTTEADVLNYMSSIGWLLADVHAGGYGTQQEVFYFKRTFDSSELK